MTKRLAFVVGACCGAASHVFVLGLLGGPFYWKLFLAISFGNGFFSIATARFLEARQFRKDKLLAERELSNLIESGQLTVVPAVPKSGYEIGLYNA